MNSSQRTLLWIVSVLAIVATLYFFSPLLDSFDPSDNHVVKDIDDDDNEDDVQNHQFALSVELTEAAQKMASIESQTLMESFYTPEIRAMAVVIPTRELQFAHSRCSEAKMNLRMAKVNEQAMSKELSRLKTLQQATGSVASKEVNYAQTNLSLAQAESELKQQLVDNCHAEVRQQWPQPVADWVINGGEEFNLLMSRDQSIMKVTLPPKQSLNPNVDTVRWQQTHQQNNVGQAQRLAAAISVDPVVSGETWFFLNKSSSLQEGAKLQVWVPTEQGAFSAVLVPYQSVVWYAGQPWAYLHMDEQRFQRISLLNGHDSVEGIYLQQGFHPGDAVVTSGAQTLLSEEFKWQIHDEDDDDD
ncbi:MAG: hypothetical protein COA34_002875 [Methylophaga sp.]|uniref:hypothetical protein n=1 Tax=Methylophaga sp. TaxID=2024840 RepID=UPI00217327C0|nr:hypothetical protein [Methylophaga sp.]MBL1456797.1 hypothetical protein [Methylophaga sp.]